VSVVPRQNFCQVKTLFTEYTRRNCAEKLQHFDEELPLSSSKLPYDIRLLENIRFLASSPATK
jgi:hypothetical protein